MTRRNGGFTLIEIMAVVAVLVLVSSIAMPNLSLLQERKLYQRAQDIASHLEFARQRTVMTGTPHRLSIDLRDGTYRLEWSVASSDDGPAEPELDEYGRASLSLAPPRFSAAGFERLPGKFGRTVQLEEEIHFETIESDQGTVDSGEYAIAFDADGTTDYTAITLQDASGKSVVLDVKPLADAVEIHDAEG